MDKNELIFAQQTIQRKHDMSPKGALTLAVDNEGDMCLSVWDDERKTLACLEFCTVAGGGGSPRTHQALRYLFLAMAEDQAANTHPSRNGRFDVSDGVTSILLAQKNDAGDSTLSM